MKLNKKTETKNNPKKPETETNKKRFESVGKTKHKRKQLPSKD